MSQKASTTIPLDRLPLGFRFRPTDEELINNYLKLKINGRIRPSDAAAVAEVDVCRLEPWDLPARSAIKSDDQEWFFFAPVDRKYPSGNRSNRATEAGYWKATGKDRFIRSRTRGGTEVVGMKKTLVFHKGRAPRGERTHWIMHEYRTVEREFEEGGFVLCRLFRKSEEKVPGTNTPELEGSGFSPIPTKFSPINTLHIDDVVEGEYAAPLNEKYPVSDMQEESRPLPGTNNNQLTDSKQDDKAYYLIPCPNKSEESQSNDNTTIDERGQMAERKDSSLYDELPGFLGPEYEHIFSDQCLQFNSISYDIDEELPTQLQYAELEEDSVSDFLESMLSTPEISSGLSGNETSLATMAVSGRFGAAHEGSWNSFMDNDACSSRNVDYDPLILIAQVGDPAVSSQERQLLGASESLQMGISDRLDEIRGPLEILGTVKSSSRELASPIESGTLPSHSSQHVEDSVGRTNCLETEINIRLRDLEKLESSTDVFVRHQSSTDVFVRHQGTADRRFKLQESLKSIEKKRQRRSSIVNDEVGKVVKNQTTTGNEVSEPARTNRVAFQSRVDGFSPDVQTALSLPEPVKPRSRSRRRSVVPDNKTEGPTLHVATSRVCSVSTLRIGVAVLAIASLICAGAVWYLNS